MSIATAYAKNELATKYGQLGGWISVHTGPPGTNGQNEAAGNGYARKQTSWGTASNGTITGSEVEIDAGAGQYVSAGLWTAQTGGTFIDTVAVVNTTLGAVGKLKVTPTYTQT
ncbi:phage tail fiber protein [Rhodococcus koreensis]|uniref:phage tail fiber protein n=1 Tax=Rhodococcus koreensis TaxID=99653 RepID=UPI0036DCC45F